MSVEVIKGDCLSALDRFEPASFDMVLSDLPYGKTRNAWDTPIPFAPMWEQIERVSKPNAAIVLMAAQPFASQLIVSNLPKFRYDLIWQKNKPTGFLNANRQPLRSHEHILVFYGAQPTFNPQKTQGHSPVHAATQTSHGKNYGRKTRAIKSGGSTERFPLSVLKMPIINNDDPEKTHPTQKPVELMAWLINSFSNPGDSILDVAAGSGTTGVAAHCAGRDCVLIEADQEYADIARLRIKALTTKEQP